MRRPLGRILTILPLFVLITLSFLVFLTQASAFDSSDHLLARHSRHLAAKRFVAPRQGRPGGGGGGGGDDDDDDDEPPGVTTSATDTTEPTTTSSDSTTSLTTSTSESTSDPGTSFTTSSVSESTFSTESTSSLESASTSTSTSQSSSESTIQSTSEVLSATTSSTASTSSQTSTSLTSSSTSRSTPITTVPGSTATAVVVASTPRLTSTVSATSSVETSAAATGTESASTSGFLSNKGAMAGTFTALGILVVGAVCAAVLFIRKKKRNEDLDIFDTEYKEYSSGNAIGGSSNGDGDYFASDMSSLSANAVTHAGARSDQPDYSHVDYGFGMPATAADRTSVASNHAGYGAFRSAAEQRKPPMQRSGLRQEINWSNDAAYAEPAVDENQSMHVIPSHGDYNGQYYTPATRLPGRSY